MTDGTLRLAIALEGAGWHPAAWREPTSRPEELFTAEYWVDLVQAAEAGGLDLVTIEDSLSLQSSDPLVSDTRTDEVRGRLDALLLASRIAPLTTRIGLVPTVTVTHTEPFHVSTAVASLDHASLGRAGWQVKVSARTDESPHFGRGPGRPDGEQRDPAVQAHTAAIFDEAADVVEVARRLWDSWEDDAEIRDAATDRFLDADRLHTIDFDNGSFSVRGPAITPRPPQGQPVVAALAHAPIPYRLAARSADVVFVTPLDLDHAAEILAQVRREEQAADRAGAPLLVFADVLVFLDSDAERAADRLARLDALGRPLTSDTRVFTGSATDLAGELDALRGLGYDGVRLRPGVVTDDLPRIARDLVPALEEREAFRIQDHALTLRQRLGLPAAAPSRYAPAAV